MSLSRVVLRSRLGAWAAKSSNGAVAVAVAEIPQQMQQRSFASQAKAKDKKKKGGKFQDQEFESMLRVAKGVYKENFKPFTEEEMQRFFEIGREYNRMTSITHNHLMRDLQTKIDLKWEAINALPAELQAEAMEDDDAPMPPHRMFPTWTPPIEGFVPRTAEDD